MPGKEWSMPHPIPTSTFQNAPSTPQRLWYTCKTFARHWTGVGDTRTIRNKLLFFVHFPVFKYYVIATDFAIQALSSNAAVGLDMDQWAMFAQHTLSNPVQKDPSPLLWLLGSNSCLGSCLVCLGTGEGAQPSGAKTGMADTLPVSPNWFLYISLHLKPCTKTSSTPSMHYSQTLS